MKIFSSNKSKDKVSPHIPEEEKKSHGKDKRSREESKKKRNSDSEPDRARKNFEISTPKEKESTGSDEELGNFSP